MARTAAFSIPLGILFAWSWSRLEEPRTGIGPLLLMVALGVAPVFLPTRRLRLAGVGLALLLAAAFALDARPYSLGTLLSRAGRGFLDFYDVTVPFDGSAHRMMHGVVLLAVFLFTLLAALAVRARLPLVASLVMVAGAGWPATIYPDSRRPRSRSRPADLRARAGRPAEAHGRRAAPQVLVGAALVVVALVASSSGAVAKAQFLDWQNWDLSKKQGPTVSVSYVWKANYSGISFPKKRTRVFTVRGAVSLGVLARDDAGLVRQGPLARRAALGRADPAPDRRTRIWMRCTTRRCSPTPRPTGATGARRRSTWRRSATPTW